MRGTNEDKVWVCAAINCGHLIRGNMNEPWKKLETGQHIHTECEGETLSVVEYRVR